MSEFTTLYQVTGAGLALVLSSCLYSLGGRDGGPGKWVRRFLGSFVLTLTICVIALLRGNFSLWLITTYIPLSAGYSIGYGGWATTTWLKVVRRSIYALAVIMAGVICAIVLHGWAVFIPHIGVAAWSIYLGVRNPVQGEGGAVVEEFMVSMSLNLFLLVYPFIGVV